MALAETQKPLHKLASVFGSMSDFRRVCPDGAVTRESPQKETVVPLDYDKLVAEIVYNAGCQPAHDLHLLRLAQVSGERRFACNVMKDADDIRQLSGTASHGTDGDRRAVRLAIPTDAFRLFMVNVPLFELADGVSHHGAIFAPTPNRTESAPDHLARLPTRDCLERGVHILHSAAPVHDNDAILRVIGRNLKAVLTTPGIASILGRNDNSPYPAGAIGDRIAPQMDRSGHECLIQHRHWLTVFHRRLNSGRDPLAQVLREQFPKRLADRLSRRCSERDGRLSVKGKNQAFAVDEEGHIIRCAHHVPRGTAFGLKGAFQGPSTPPGGMQTSDAREHVAGYAAAAFIRM